MIPAKEALQRLREGNLRFVSDVRASNTLSGQNRRNEVAAGQERKGPGDRLEAVGRGDESDINREGEHQGAGHEQSVGHKRHPGTVFDHGAAFLQ